MESTLCVFFKEPVQLYTFFLRRKQQYIQRVSGRQEYYPPMQSAKLVCEYLRFLLEEGAKIRVIFTYLRYWQLSEVRIRRYVGRGKELLQCKYPVIGIRVLVRGSFKKGKRTHDVQYHLWLRKATLTRAMPLQRFHFRIEYYQLNIFLLTASLGLKVWLAYDEKVE